MFEENKDSEKMCEEDKDSEHIDETKPVEYRLSLERFKHLWVLCENCDAVIYKQFFLEQKGVCEECGATLQITSSERIELLIDNETWCPMDMNFSSTNVLETQHTTFDIKAVQRLSTMLYIIIENKYFDFEFFHKEKNGLKTLVGYNITLVNIVKVVLEKKFIKYLSLDKKETIKILKNIIDTGLKTVQFVLFEIHKKITHELARLALFSLFSSILTDYVAETIYPPRWFVPLIWFIFLKVFFFKGRFVEDVEDTSFFDELFYSLSYEILSFFQWDEDAMYDFLNEDEMCVLEDFLNYMTDLTDAALEAIDHESDMIMEEIASMDLLDLLKGLFPDEDDISISEDLIEQVNSMYPHPFFDCFPSYSIQPVRSLMDLIENNICTNLTFLMKFIKQLANLKEQLVSQDKFLKVTAVNLVKIELDFPEEKRKARKIKKLFPFYPGNNPETNYCLWLRKHTAICLMERYLVLKNFKYWFKSRCCGLLKGEEFYRFGSDILVEYVKKKDRYQCYNSIDHIIYDENIIIYDEKIDHNIVEDHYRRYLDEDPYECDNSIDDNHIIHHEEAHSIEKDLILYYKKNEKDCDSNLQLCSLNYKKDSWSCMSTFFSNPEPVSEEVKIVFLDLLEIMKHFSTITLDSKEKFCKKNEETYIEDIEDTEDIEEEYPLTYASLTKEEKEYVDASVKLIKSTLNLGKDDFIDIETEEQCYDDYNTSYQEETGLPDAIQTGIGLINGKAVALGVMDFQFMGGSMGSVVGEKITRLIQYATDHFLPLILVCASGGARMQEGSFSLMQMNKIAAVLHTHQKEKRLPYISVLTSPTTGGVTASFGMLANVTIVEPNAYIAFAGKRVIEQTLNQIVDDEDQVSDSLFDFGMFDSMVPRALLKNVLSEIIELYMEFN